ncbi:LuxR C-terminal-related transcriptional regulator [Streptomyces sp. NEAU-L66]|uniref:response regulator transcription factor n=1 Tax=Streptomyces sp. NEAU-L66 TaxID=3390812 RepID=UPI0039C6829F
MQVLEKNPLLRAGVMGSLEGSTGFSVHASLAPAEAMDFAWSDRPDVTLLGDGFPGSECLIEELSTLPEPPAVAVLRDLPSRVEVDMALRSGVSGVIPCDASPEVLRRSVHLLSEGAVVVFSASRPEQGRRRTAGSLTAHPRLAGLTDRERSVLFLLARGLTNMQISRRLSLQPDTVKEYIRSIYLKCRVSGRVEAALLAYGIVPPSRKPGP